MSEHPLSRVVIAGCSGAGKSRLARALGRRTGLPVIHLDRLFWKPGWTESTRAEFAARHAAVLQQDRWIIDGNFGRTLETRVLTADTLIILDFPLPTCLAGIASRLWQYQGRIRPDLPDGCPEQLDWEFLEWVFEFRAKSRPQLVDIAQRFRLDKNVHWFTSRKQMNRWLSTISKSE